MADLNLPKGVFKLGARPETGKTKGFPFGFAERGVHELCEASYGHRAAALAFVAAHVPQTRGPLLVISEARQTRDQGRWYDMGLEEFTGYLPPIVHVEARKSHDALWATEEALHSAVPRLIIAETAPPDFTASRRLSLAAERNGIPLILLLPYTAEGSTAAAGRWRIRSQPSATNLYDPAAPGAFRCQVMAERLRAAPEKAGSLFNLEFDHETLSFHLASGLAPHPAEPRSARQGPGRQALRAG